MDVYLHSETALLVNFPLAQVNALHTHPASMPKTLVEPYTGIRSTAQKMQEKKERLFSYQGWKMEWLISRDLCGQKLPHLHGNLHKFHIFSSQGNK